MHAMLAPVLLVVGCHLVVVGLLTALVRLERPLIPTPSEDDGGVHGQ